MGLSDNTGLHYIMSGGKMVNVRISRHRSAQLCFARAVSTHHLPFVWAWPDSRSRLLDSIGASRLPPPVRRVQTERVVVAAIPDSASRDMWHHNHLTSSFRDPYRWLYDLAVREKLWEWAEMSVHRLQPVVEGVRAVNGSAQRTYTGFSDVVYGSVVVSVGHGLSLEDRFIGKASAILRDSCVALEDVSEDGMRLSGATNLTGQFLKVGSSLEPVPTTSITLLVSLQVCPQHVGVLQVTIHDLFAGALQMSNWHSGPVVDGYVFFSIPSG